MLQRLRRGLNRTSPSAGSTSKKDKPAEAPFSFLSATSILIIAVALAVLITIIVARAEHRWNYKQQIIINDFLVTAQGSLIDKKSSEMSTFGKEASDLFASDLNDVIQQGSGFSTSNAAKGRYAQPFDGVPKVPVSKSYGIEIQGVSIDQVINAWNGMRFDQQNISGDVLPDSASADRYVLKISIRSDRQDQQLTSSAFLPSSKEVDDKIRALAENYVAINNPEIAGRYYLAAGRYPAAIDVFTVWMKNEPNSPEPRLYLAKALILAEQFDRAGQFVSSARVRLDADVRGTSKNRKRLQNEIDLADATAKWGSGDIEGALKLFTGSLKDEPSALNNLGTLYLEKQRYTEAEEALKHAFSHNGQNAMAALLLGETYSADKHYPEAEKWFATAMGIRPTWAQGAEEYVEAMEASHDDAGAMQYCHSWIGATVGSEAMVTDSRADLYSLCAEAELSKPKAKPTELAGDSTLAWYYSLALSHAGVDTSHAPLLQDLIFKMPDVLCHVKSDGAMQWSPQVETPEEPLLANGRTKLLAKLRGFAKDPNNHQAAALLKRCEASAAGG